MNLILVIEYFAFELEASKVRTYLLYGNHSERQLTYVYADNQKYN